MDKVLLIDMDDVLAGLVPAWLDFLSRRHKIKLGLEDIASWDIAKAIQVKYPQLTSSLIWEPLSEPGLFRKLSLIPGAKKSLQTLLARGWELVIVTSLPPHNKQGMVLQEKKEWLKEHLAGIIDNNSFITAYKKYLIRGDVLIDDGPHNLESFPGLTIAFDRPWNRNSKCSRRVTSWQEVPCVCEELIRSKQTDEHQIENRLIS